MNHYIVLGGPEHLDWFEHFEDDPLSQFFWTVPKDAQVDEVAFVYLTAPVSRIVGKVLIAGAPFYNISQFENPKTKNKWMAEIKFVGYFEPKAGLTMRGLRSLFPDWAWLSYPRSATKIPSEIVEPLLELTGSVGLG
jgi:hypothetical protein